MSRKEYRAIAEAIRQTHELWAEEYPPDKRPPHVAASDALYGLAMRLSVELGADNPRFDAARFMKACGFED